MSFMSLAGMQAASDQDSLLQLPSQAPQSAGEPPQPSVAICQQLPHGCEDASVAN